MTTTSITFGHAAAAGGAPIEDALNSLLKAGSSSAKRRKREAKRLLLRAHLRLLAVVRHHGRSDLRRALDAADLLAAADIVAALVNDPTLRKGEVFRGLIELYVPAWPKEQTTRNAPILSCHGSRREMEPMMALIQGDIEPDAPALAAWIETVDGLSPRSHYGSDTADGVAFVADTLLAAYRDEDELPDSDTVSAHALMASAYAAILGWQAKTRAEARAARAGAGA